MELNNVDVILELGREERVLQATAKPCLKRQIQACSEGGTSGKWEGAVLDSLGPSTNPQVCGTSAVAVYSMCLN